MILEITCPQCDELRQIHSKSITADEHGKIAKCPLCGPFYTKFADCSCDQCEAIMINGIYCHEKGCRNTNKIKRDGDWVNTEPNEYDVPEEYYE